MIERGMLYSEPMAVAPLNGTKSQTRRAMKAQPHEDWRPAGYGELNGFDKHGELSPDVVVGWGAFNEDGDQGYSCPHGQPGDRIWVRETFIAYGRWVTRFSAKKARDEWHFVDMTLECDRAYQYAADKPDVPLATGRGGALPGWYTRPAIFMPRAASRILLEIVSVRVVRLNDCSEADALDEGIDADRLAELQDSYDIVRKGAEASGQATAQSMYRELWESINGAGSWAANPWCWAIEFKRVTP